MPVVELNGANFFRTTACNLVNTRWFRIHSRRDDLVEGCSLSMNKVGLYYHNGTSGAGDEQPNHIELDPFDDVHIDIADWEVEGYVLKDVLKDYFDEKPILTDLIRMVVAVKMVRLELGWRYEHAAIDGVIDVYRGRLAADSVYPGTLAEYAYLRGRQWAAHLSLGKLGDGELSLVAEA